MDWLTSLVAAEHWRSEYLLRLLVASVLGAVIGLEREYHGRSAGFRTQLLVGLGSALVMVVSLQFMTLLAGSSNPSIRADVARAIGGVMGGIGFLGAGVIFRHPLGIRGLTTAASLWCTAAVGLACGAGMYVTAGMTTCIVMFALLILGWLEERLPVRVTKSVTLVISGTPDAVEIQRRLSKGLYCTLVQVDEILDGGTVRLVFQVSISGRTSIAKVADAVRETPGLKQIIIT